MRTRSPRATAEQIGQFVQRMSLPLDQSRRSLSSWAARYLHVVVLVFGLRPLPEVVLQFGSGSHIAVERFDLPDPFGSARHTFLRTHGSPRPAWTGASVLRAIGSVSGGLHRTLSHLTGALATAIDGKDVSAAEGVQPLVPPLTPRPSVRHAAQSARRPGTRPHAFPQVRGPVGHYGATVRKRAHHSQRVRVRVPDGAPTLMAHPPCMASADDLLSSPGPTSLRVSSAPVARAANVVAPDREEDDDDESCVALVDRQVVIVRAVVLPSRTCHFPSHSSRGKGPVNTGPW